MKWKIKYGLEEIEFRIPDVIDVKYLDCPEYFAQDEIKTVRGAMDNPLGIPKLENFISGNDTVAIVVSDYTRPTGVPVYLKEILRVLKEVGLPKENIKIVVALGLHRAANKKEITEIVGEKIASIYSVENHDPDKNLLDIGTTWINKTVGLSSKIIVTGAVTFHPMAGYSGGYKSIVPGIAARENIIENHRLYFKGNKVSPFVGPAKTSGNPVLRDLMRKAKSLKNVFGLNVVMGLKKEIIYAAAGELESVWQVCSRYVKKTFSVDIEDTYPIVCASAGGHPLDFSFYQSMKLFTNASRACTAGGTIVLFSACTEGWELDAWVMDLFRMPLPEAIIRLQSNFSMAGLAAVMAKKIIHQYKVYFYSKLPPEDVRKTGMIPLESKKQVQDLMNTFSRKKLAVVGKASVVFPICEGKEYD